MKLDKPEFPRPDFISYEFAVAVFAAAIAFIIINLFGGVDKTTLNLAAQGLISMAAFIAGASIVMTSFYMAQVLRGVPDMAKKLIPSVEGIVTKMDPRLGPELQRIQKEGKGVAELWKAILESFASAFKESWEGWSKALEGLMSFPKMIREVGSHIIYFLIVSTFFSVLTILSGWIYALGLSFACIIIAVGTLLRSWRNAERAIEGFVFLSSFIRFLEGIAEESKKQN